MKHCGWDSPGGADTEIGSNAHWKKTVKFNCVAEQDFHLTHTLCVLLYITVTYKFI